MRRVVFLTALILVLANTSLKAAPFLQGTVTDDNGRPVEGATVTILDCVGTCFGGATRLTDRNGHYLFEDKTFRNWPMLTIAMPGRYEVSRTSTGPELGASDENPKEEETGKGAADKAAARRVDFVLGTPAAIWLRCKEQAPKGWTQRIHLAPGRETKVRRYDIQAQSHSRGLDDHHWFTEVPRNEELHVVVVREPIVEPSDDPKVLRERQRDSWRKAVSIIGPAMRLPDPQRYDINVQIVPNADSGLDLIRIESIHDALHRDRTAELAPIDPRFAAPVDAATEEKARDLLRRTAAAATPWNARPGRTITYEYDAVTASGESTHVRITPESPAGPAWSDISRLRGFAYMPPLRWLFSQPENVVIQGFATEGARTRIHYRLKSSRGFTIGIGIGSSWNGFLQSGFSAGTLVVDSNTAAVLEHRFSKGPLEQESVESFDDLVAVQDGFAPRTLRIRSGSFDATFTFRIHKERLWLLDHARREADPKPVFEIRNVNVSVANEEQPQN